MRSIGNLASAQSRQNIDLAIAETERREIIELAEVNSSPEKDLVVQRQPSNIVLSTTHKGAAAVSSNEDLHLLS